MQKKQHNVYKNLFITENGDFYSSSGKKLKTYLRAHNKRGKYLYLQFKFEGKQYKIKVKDLVMETFGEKKDVTVNIDGDYKNNSINNLKSMTYEEYVQSFFKDKKVKRIERRGLVYVLISNGEMFSTKCEIFMNKFKDRKGYYYYSIHSRENGEKKYKIHRLVAETFIENSLEKKTINHIDANKENNNVENLEWATHKEQMKHVAENKLQVPKNKKKVNMLKDGKVLKTFESFSEAARYVGTTTIEISTAARGIRKTAKGYEWKIV